MKQKATVFLFLLRRISVIFLTVTVMFSVNPLYSLADNSSVLATYSGSTVASYNYRPDCTFIVNKIVNNKFRGQFIATNLGRYNLNENVEGSVIHGNNYLILSFSIPAFYNTSFEMTVYPYTGICHCITNGSWHFEDFDMNGTVFSDMNLNSHNTNSLFDVNDYKLCMNLCYNSYGDSYEHYMVKINNKNYRCKIPKDLQTFISFETVESGPDYIFNSDSVYSKNYNDFNKNNASFTITYRENEDASADMFVVIRGTDCAEWQGNAEITGTQYTEMDEHYNFKQGEESIKIAINNYYNHLKYSEGFNNINLVITGHSRGAAIANLYAKDANDRKGGSYSGTLIPYFSNIVAYTFATPNVAKYDEFMESYDNIFNFCFEEDLVPTVPLTKNGWNYWKYGTTYVCNIKDLSLAKIGAYYPILNEKAVSNIHSYFGEWDDVQSYYEKLLYQYNIDGEENIPSTLYTFIHSSLNVTRPLLVRKFFGVSSALYHFSKYPDLQPIIMEGIKHKDSFSTAHSYDTYRQIICNKNTDETIFKPINYYIYNSLINSYSLEDSQVTFSLLNDSVEYNASEVQKLINLYNNNSDLLDWDIDDPITWDKIIWDSNGNVQQINLAYMNLSGTLNLSDFSSLAVLNISGNNLTSINLTNCSSLEELDCSFNQLTTLDISDCTNLLSLTCCYNYLDTHEGGALYNTFDDLMFNDCYVNYYPQAVPDNASFNTTELNIFKTFANTANNNSELDWLDDSGNIDTQKLQNNVLFEYDGSKYRVVAIDISDTNVEGTLNLTSFAQLKELYCENTKLVSLNLNGCTKLNTLHCDGSNLTTITLPSNSSQKTSPLYDVSCEYNYLDTSIFTQNIITYVEFKAGGKIEYLNQKGEDSSALQAAISFANTLEENDYSTESFEELSDILEECNYYNFDNLYLTQNDIDELTANILTAIYNLKAYFEVKVSAPNGSLSIAYDDETSNDSGTYSILYGTTVTLNATADNDCTFVGWYDTVSNRYLSNDAQYSFKVDSNINLKAVIIPNGFATLTFANYSNWIAGTITKTTTEWAELTSIEDLLPNVPYRYGYSNGRWVYNDSAVLALLQLGQDVNIGAEYDEDNASFPTPRVAVDKPVLDLYYNYDSDNLVGSFVMAAGFPEDIEVESVGIAFYYKKANQFDPTDNFTLLLNNKMLVGRFNTDVLEDVYITNMNKMTSTYNWAARGYVTYYDENNNLVTAYSNQINVIDTRNADEIPVETSSLPEDDLDDDIPPYPYRY